jgi:hypothetical protein
MDNGLALVEYQHTTTDDQEIDDLLEHLFCPYSDSEFLIEEMKEFYKDRTILPEFAEIEEYFIEHNDEISYQITDIETKDACSCCDQKSICWKDCEGWTDDWGWDWDVPQEREDCFSDQRSCNDEYLGYNWEAWNIRGTILKIVLGLGYAMWIDSAEDLNDFFEDPPYVFLKHKKLIANDAQMLLIPEMKSAWGPKPLFLDHPLLIT